jgi:fermentation-respiration switch protein FrsA (DUF1100 family)
MFILLGFLAAIVIALLLLVRLGQRRLIYLPTVEAPPPVASLLPQAEEILIDTADGLRLAAWFLDAGDPAAATVLVFHGNGGHRAHRAPLAAALARHGISVMLTDYRGYGGNPGRPSEDGLLNDARGALDWLETHGRDGPVIYFGESLGTGVAVALAVERPPDGLVLRSPFTSIPDVARHHYPLLPVHLLLTERFDSLRRIVDLNCPLIVLLGSNDRVIPAAQSRRLYVAATMEQKRLVVIQGADHNDASLLDGDTLIREVVAFMDSLTSTTRGPSRPAFPDPEAR